MKVILILFLIYILMINVFTFALMGIDKRRAIRHDWRIPEKTLFLSALLGGGIGAVIGMYTFRHKTKHWYFVVGMPGIIMLNLILTALIFGIIVNGTTY